MNLLDMMEQYGTPGFVFSSSCTVYGQPKKLPVTETFLVKVKQMTLDGYKKAR